MIKFLDWLAGLRPTPCIKMVPKEADPPGPASFLPQPPPDVAAAIDQDLDRRIADGFMSYAEAIEDHKQAVADLRQLQLSKPPFPPDASLQLKVLTIGHGMKLRAVAEGAAAAQLREIAESLDGVVAAEQGSIPATTDSGQILVTPPKPQPPGGRLFINGIEQPQPTGPETLLEMVGYAIAEVPWEDEAKGAVLAVAQWLRSQGAYTAVALLEREISK